MFAYLISLPHSPRTAPAFERLTTSFPDFTWIVSPGVRVAETRLTYEEMRELECYRNWKMLHDGYPARAVGCRLAGLQAISQGLQNALLRGDPYFAIFQDDATPSDDASQRLQSLLHVNGGDWECLWLDETQLMSPKGPNGQLLGARLATGMVLRTEYASDIVERLSEASCEWDVWMHREMANGRKYFSDQIVRQMSGVSEITGRLK
ncbi:hypothetical protein Pan97_33740 [Bremerella volcania]|uniref:Glycosyltransferase family 25 (LPS biosynthesis protein) n=1 Tax=Bremerella volcania TaxID=2527984 RepID=A0A518CAR5_9BACT|nr:hypothetical protein [Bremerella volcania]QDU76326.1 hypothetical protein Pan97_33740 [Bremerella volcania]